MYLAKYGVARTCREALSAKDGLVVVVNRDQPDAVTVRLSLVRSARMARMPLATFIAHVSRLGIAAVSHDAADVQRDMQSADQANRVLACGM